jgi:hypothetical protein
MSNVPIWRDLDHAVNHARTTCSPRDYAEAVGARAHAEQVCIWHAAYLVNVDRYESGETSAVCSLCGGRSLKRAFNADGAHGMCAARRGRGRPTPRIEGGPECDCSNCRPGTRLF